MNDAGAAQFYDRYWEFRAERGDATAANRIKLRHEQAVEFVRRRLPDTAAAPTPGAVLDMGCGDGIIGQMLSAHGYHVTGLDVSQRAVQLAAAHYSEVRQFDLDQDDVPPQWLGAFDAVICLEVLEHIEQPERNIARAFEVCRSGGVAVFSFPNLFSWKNRWMFLRGRWPSGYTTYDPREHLQVFELPQFKNWVTQAGFRLLGTAITPDLPKLKPLRRAMFSARHLLNRLGPALWAMQINVFAEKP